MTDHNIPHKANRVLNVILLALLLILIRVWYLGVVQYEYHLQQSRKPQRRVVVEHVERATIRDRFNVPMAFNKIQYNAAVCYAQIRQVPSIIWRKDEKGKRVRFLARSAYITDLSKLLAEELDLDPVKIEDTIHGKASLFPHTPFVIKENISEAQYYRLKMLERQWNGIQAERSSSRIYPQGKTAGDIIGYMGAINQKEYHHIAQEMKELQQYLAQREEGEVPILPKGFNSPIEVRERLKELQEKVYTINDFVGKSGIEGAYDEQLRGFMGKKTYEVDIKGNFLRELPGSRDPIGGQRILLSISSELQQYAEMLLSQYESLRDRRDEDEKNSLAEPWVKGGAIVAMLPNTGEVLALASFPRFDPNDFIPSSDPQKRKEKHSALLRWLENEPYIAEIWDGKRPMEREGYSYSKKTFYEESVSLSWERYLEAIIPKSSAIHEALKKVSTLQNAVQLQIEMESLLLLTEETDMRSLIQLLYSDSGHIPSRFASLQSGKKITQEKLKILREAVVPHKKFIDYFLLPIRHNDDKLLLLDLCRMRVEKEKFNDALLNAIGNLSLSSFHDHSQAACTLQSKLQSQIQELFHDLDFTEWRRLNFKNFLKEKRKEEKAKRQYTRPYTEYLDLLEKKMFKEFWSTHRALFLETYILGKARIPLAEHPQLQPYLAHLLQMRAESELQIPHIEKLKTLLTQLDHNLSLAFLQTIRPFEELNRPLYGKYRGLRKGSKGQLEKHLAAAFYPLSGYGYGRSQAYRQSTPQGSVFKLVTAYEALRVRYETLKETNKSLLHLNPLTLSDNLKWNATPGSNSQILGHTEQGQAITRLYKGGRLPRSSHSGIGTIDVLGALEQSSNIYFSLLASEHMEGPDSLAKAARQFGFGEKTGIELPGEIPGIIPSDLAHNKTGLYSFAIGQHSLVVTPLQTAVLLSAVGNGGKVLKPRIVQIVAGKEPSREEDLLFTSSSFPFKDDLSLVGVNFPLFTEALKNAERPHISHASAEVKRHLFFPKEIRHLLLEGMRRVITGPRGTSRASQVRTLYQNPQIKDFIDLQHQLVGKTGTAEILYKQTIDSESEPEMHTHVWFSGLSFSSEHALNKDAWKEPELAIVVYLRFGEAGGKEASPLAAALVRKWREICAKYGKSSYIYSPFSLIPPEE